MSDKYQKEIEEILKNAGEVAPEDAVGEMERPLDDRPKALSQASSPNKPPVSYTPRGRWPSITPGKILMTGLFVFIVTALLQIWVLIWVGFGPFGGGLPSFLRHSQEHINGKEMARRID